MTARLSIRPVMTPSRRWRDRLGPSRVKPGIATVADSDAMPLLS